MDAEGWKQFATQLLWHNIVYHKNEYSGYDVIINGEDRRISMDTSFLSYYVGAIEKLTWKGLALELGLFEDHLVPDGHDCKNCPHRKDCIAYFKDDQDHEKCSWWTENVINK